MDYDWPFLALAHPYHIASSLGPHQKKKKPKGGFFDEDGEEEEEEEEEEGSKMKDEGDDDATSSVSVSHALLYVAVLETGATTPHSGTPILPYNNNPH